MVSGSPGYYPDDLIDVVLSDDGTEVSIGFDAGLERPVRLTAEEAVALTVALRALGESSGLVAGDAVSTALAKLEAVTVAVPPPSTSSLVTTSPSWPRWQAITTSGSSGCATTRRPATNSPSGPSTRCG